MSPVGQSLFADQLADLIEDKKPTPYRYQISVRVSQRIHHRLRDMAIDGGMSMNEFVNYLFRSYIAIKDKQLKEEPISYRDYEPPKREPLPSEVNNFD